MKTVILDIGNVVVRWDPHAVYLPRLGSRAAVDAFFAEVNFAAWNLEQDRGRDWDEAVALLSDEHPNRAELIALYRDQLMVAHPELVAGMDALICDLHAASVPLVALSNTSARTAAELALKFPKVWSRFDDVVVSGAHRMLKPEAAIYRLCLERSGLEAGEAIFVDDSPKNVAGAVAVGIDAIHFTDAETLRRDLRERGIP